MRIQNKELTKKDIGKYVKYTPPFEGGISETGRIKSWNTKFVFVVYRCDNNWDEYEKYTAAATNPYDLIFIHENKDLLK